MDDLEFIAVIRRGYKETIKPLIENPDNAPHLKMALLDNITAVQSRPQLQQYSNGRNALAIALDIYNSLREGGMPSPNQLKIYETLIMQLELAVRTGNVVE